MATCCLKGLLICFLASDAFYDVAQAFPRVKVPIKATQNQGIKEGGTILKIHKQGGLALDGIWLYDAGELGLVESRPQMAGTSIRSGI